ncbi:MAG TPA: glycosyltransferase [Vicinamibacterales bacterium]
MTRGVTFVVPVLNGRRALREVFSAIATECRGREHEILAVDDGSRDGSMRILRQLEADGVLRVLNGAGHGAAAAINAGFREARYPVVCQVDQDVIVRPGWLDRLLSALEDPDVAAAQGHYRTAAHAGFWARAMGRDLEQRYAAIRGAAVDHVCTGNTAYRVSALRQVGGLDESMGYGYDNDLSYRLVAAGYRLVFCPTATSVHLWKEGLRGYVTQQFGVGYGRLDVLARHPRRAGGDDVSGTLMMMHGPAMLAAIALAAIGAAAAQPLPAIAAAVIVAVLAAERAIAGLRAWRQSRDGAALGFAAAHLVRDLTWAFAIVLWGARRLAGRSSRPSHSMPRHPSRTFARTPPEAALDAVLAIIPAFNEAENLPRVVAELRRVVPGLDLLIVNDGSTDDTEDLLPSLDVRWITLPQRVGVGGAVKTGIRYALREGYRFAVRIDGDGQHRPCDVGRLLAPVLAGRADVTIGSRFVERRRARGARRFSQAMLAAGLSLVTGRRITDPTSGFWVFGPRALRMLARHYPAGYSEPELVLLLHRNGVRMQEIPIRMRPRIAGRTSLTATRAIAALARTLLAMLVVPFRQAVEDARD